MGGVMPPAPAPAPAHAVPSPSCSKIDMVKCKRMKKEELVKFALKCNIINSKKEGDAMTKEEICKLINRPKQPSSRFSDKMVEEIERLLNTNVTKRQLKLMEQKELAKIAKILEVAHKDRDVIDIVNDIVIVVTDYINYKEAQEVPMPVQAPVHVPMPVQQVPGTCYNGMTKAQLKSSKTKLSDLKAYAEALNIKGVDTKARLAEYICAAGMNKRCSVNDNNCGDGDYCDISNGLCIDAEVAQDQVNKSKVSFDSFENNGRNYIGKSDDIAMLKRQMAAAGAGVGVGVGVGVFPQVPFQGDACYNGMTKAQLNSSKTKLSDLKAYAEALNIKGVDTKARLAEYICAAGMDKRCSADGNNCGDGEYCDISNGLCVGAKVGQGQVEKTKGYEMLEHDGKAYIGKSLAIRQLKHRLESPSMPAPMPMPSPMPMPPSMLKPPPMLRTPPMPPPSVPVYQANMQQPFIVPEQVPISQPFLMPVLPVDTRVSERVCVDDKTRSELRELSTADLKLYAQNMGIDLKEAKSRKVILDYLCSYPCDNLGCDDGEFCDIENNRCVGLDVKNYRADNMGFVEAEIDGKLVIGKQADIDNLIKNMQQQQQYVPPEPGSPSPVTSPAGQGLSEDDIENILDDITNGRPPVKLQKLSEVERSILGCLGIL
jgi:hypothetical protein